MEASDVFNLVSNVEVPAGAADYIEYDITVETDSDKCTIKTTDLTMDSRLEPLVRFLREFK